MKTDIWYGPLESRYSKEGARGKNGKKCRKTSKARESERERGERLVFIRRKHYRATQLARYLRYKLGRAYLGGKLKH